MALALITQKAGRPERKFTTEAQRTQREEIESRKGKWKEVT
jgi:hypothetical protein